MSPIKLKKKQAKQKKRENQQQTKTSNIEKENNIKKKLQEERDTLKKQMTDLKTLNLYLQREQNYTDNKIKTP